MEYSKFKNHRDSKYLIWMRTQHCAASSRRADVAHHVNIGTNGGKGIKASDYFCIPLTNEFHTTGLWAVHSIGEVSFFENFKLCADDLFCHYLKKYITIVLKISVKENNFENSNEYIHYLTEIIHPFAPQPRKKSKSKMNKRVVKNVLAPSCEKMKVFKPQVKVKMSETSHYQKSKELKKQYDKEHREKNKKKLSDYRKQEYQKRKEYYKNLVD